MNLAVLLYEEKTPESTAEAKELYHEVIAGQTEHYGPRHVETLKSKMNLAVLLKNEMTPESTAEAKELYREVIAGETEHYGP
eukprot:COSAG03_NODE_6674_length_1021_cov_1.586768_2_plen_81_part_01